MMEKELADTEARQEKVDHKLKERIGKSKENHGEGETVAGYVTDKNSCGVDTSLWLLLDI